MKRITILLIGLVTLIACQKDGNSGSKLPKAGEWNVTAEFGSFRFTVNSSRDYITPMVLTHNSFSCGGVTLSGTVTLSSEPGWAIQDGKFTFETSLDPNPMTDNHTVIIKGTFKSGGDEASGTWEEIVYGSTCSTTWTAAF